MLLRAAVDFVSLCVAVLLAYLWGHAEGIDLATGRALFLFPVLGIGLLFLRGFYRPRLRLTVLNDVLSVVGTLSIAAMAYISLALSTDLSQQPSPLGTRAWILAALLVPAGRASVGALQRRHRVSGARGEPTLIVGAGLVGSHVARRLLKEPGYGLHPLGFLDADPPSAFASGNRLAPLLGAPDDLKQVVERSGARTVIIAFTRESDRRRLALVRCCQALGLDVLVVPRLFDSFSQRTTLEHLGGLPLLSLRQADPSGWEFRIKHAFDRVAAAVLLLVLAPLLLALAAGVRLSSPGPLLFRQRRVGRDCQPFDLLKFRSMRPAPAGRRRVSGRRTAPRRAASRVRTGGRASGASCGGRRWTSCPS
jgi:FlaA1/EpsC-like NDP-sugar epimerase